MGDTSDTERMRRLILLMENTNPGPDDEEEDLDHLDRSKQLDDILRSFNLGSNSRFQGVYREFGEHGWAIMQYDATGISCGSVKLKSMLVIINSDGDIALEPKAVGIDPHGHDSPWDEDDADYSSKTMMSVALQIVGRNFGLQRIEFADWNHDNNPWYYVTPRPGSPLELLSTDEGRTKLLAVADSTHK